MSATVPESMRATIEIHKMAHPTTPILLMVSGGSDSTALAHAAAQLRDEGMLGPLAIFHMNHQLRGADADADEEFVRELAESLGIPFTGVSLDVAAIAETEHGNVEAVARRERYAAAHEALVELCRRKEVPVADGRIFVAHTADDRVENFYMRSIVGTGPGGFRSMLYVNGQVARPLLDCSRDGLREYVLGRRAAFLGGVGADLEGSSIGEPWREDATNLHTDRFRAYVRHEIVPRAKERNPQLLSTLVRSMNLIADEDDMLDEMADDLVEQHVMWFEPDELGCVISPFLVAERVPMRRRVVLKVLERLLGVDERIDTSTVEAVLAGIGNSGYVANVQGNLAVSTNKHGVRIEPMAAFRTRRNRA